MFARADNAEGEKLLKVTLEGRRRILGADHPSTLLTMNNLALAYDNEGKYAEAEALLRQTLAARERVSGHDHADTVLAPHHLASTLVNEKKYREAEVLVRGYLETSRRISSKDDPQTFYLTALLASLRERTGGLVSSRNSVFRGVRIAEPGLRQGARHYS